MFIFQVVRSNFALASKLLFKLARDDANDHHFLSRKTLELYLSIGLGRNCPFNDNEAFVYGYGALKFLTLNSKVCNGIICEAQNEMKLSLIIVIMQLSNFLHLLDCCSFGFLGICATFGIASKIVVWRRIVGFSKERQVWKWSFKRTLSNHLLSSKYDEYKKKQRHVCTNQW